ncbi:type II toxin-antitoxin system death-on-curing family toxin [Opitutaceae bacterium]|nr:type II toxin-antitoxin system death-on-curing family toxin [bacterium]MDB4385682.1 type II toxin-antitoxin system death-on-curing family toxin [Opitutaceae bacterium]
MSEYYWFSRREALAAHNLTLATYGGATGIRDEAMLESALAKPQQKANYGDPSIVELAAAYSSGIIKNHPFVDGNKRTGFMLGVAFLERNGWRFHGSEAETVMHTLALAASELDEAGFAAWLEANSSPAS